MKPIANLEKNTDIELFIESIAFGGRGVAHLNEQVVFVKDAIPGQTVLSRILKKHSSFIEARKIEVIKESKHFIEPKCNHFKDCGGCTFQNFNYSEQLINKESQVKEIFGRIGRFPDVSVIPIIQGENIYQYRNKMEFTFSNRRWLLKDNDPGLNRDFALGLHISGRYDKILNIEHCDLQINEANDILSMIRSECISNNLEPYDIKYHRGFLRHLVIRTGQNTDEIMVNFVTSIEKPDLLKPIAEKLVKRFSNITSIVNNINTKKAGIAFGEWEILLSGRNFIIEKLDDFEFEISANSFFQPNTSQALKLYEIIRNECSLTKDNIVYDLYCGTGSISIFIANQVKAVYGFELISQAIENAEKNLLRNQVKNVQFFCGDLKNLLKKNSDIQSIPKPNTVILDPPRAGMHKNTVRDVIQLSPDTIVYCSCNPSTQARDIKIFCAAGYFLKKIQPIDMFPQTPHIECVATLIKFND